MRVDRLAARLERSAPALYRALLAPWRYARQYLPIDDRYWVERRHFAYYVEVERLARAHVPEGGSVLDVGAGVTRLLQRLDWFSLRVSLDKQGRARQRGIQQVTADFLDYQPPVRFNLVLCLQVIEHLEEPGPFVRKLLSTGSTIIVSVPYRRPHGEHPRHIQDPVDEEKLASWAGCSPVETRIVVDGKPRLIAVYRNVGG
jgi:hypothetical protein